MQVAYSGDKRSPPSPYLNDLLLSAIPEVSLFWGSGDSRSNLAYAMTASLRMQSGSTELSHRLTYDRTSRLGPRTLLTLIAAANYSSISNLLITSPLVTGVSGTVLPDAGIKIVGADVGETIQHELSPVLLFTQSTQLFATTTLEPAIPIDSLTAEELLTLERLFRGDAVGVETRFTGIASRRVPPDIDRDYVFVDVGPRWRRDWSRTISSSAFAGATFLVTDPQKVYPSGRATVAYTGAARVPGQGTTPVDLIADLTATTGVVPNPLTGLATRTHQVALNAGLPISVPHRVAAQGSVGVGRSELIDPTGVLPEQAFNSLFTDVTLGWQLNNFVETFLRYQFIGQIGDPNTALAPSILRDTVFLGVQFSSRPPGATSVNTRLPQRVDSADAAATDGPSGGAEAGEDDWGRRNTQSGIDDGSRARAPGSPLPVGQQPAGAQPAGAQPAGAQPAGAQPTGLGQRPLR